MMTTITGIVWKEVLLLHSQKKHDQINVPIAKALFMLEDHSGFLPQNGNSVIGTKERRRRYGSLWQDPLTTEVISQLAVGVSFVLHFRVNWQPVPSQS